VAIEAGSKRHHMPKFCATRWRARVSTLLALIIIKIIIINWDNQR